MPAGSPRTVPVRHRLHCWPVVVAGRPRTPSKPPGVIGELCDLLPEVHDALAQGTVSAGHARDVLAGVAKDLDERGRHDLKQLVSTLVESAETSSVETFSREVRKLGQSLSHDDGAATPRAGSCAGNGACAAGSTG